MPMDKYRFNIIVSRDVLSFIEKYRSEQKYATRSRSAVELIKLGVESLHKDEAAALLAESSDESEELLEGEEDQAESLVSLITARLGREPQAHELEAIVSVLDAMCDYMKKDPYSRQY